MSAESPRPPVMEAWRLIRDRPDNGDAELRAAIAVVDAALAAPPPDLVALVAAFQGARDSEESRRAELALLAYPLPEGTAAECRWCGKAHHGGPEYCQFHALPEGTEP